MQKMWIALWRHNHDTSQAVLCLHYVYTSARAYIKLIFES